MVTKEDKRFIPFIIPALFFYIIFLVYPVLSSFYYSLTNWSGISNHYRFLGIKNFVDMITDRSFVISIKNTLIFVVMDVVLMNIFGLGMALLLNMKMKTKNLLRTTFFLPVVIAPIVISFIWTYVYNYDIGILNVLLTKMGLQKIDWIGNPKIAIYFVILTGIWQWYSYRMIIYLTGLHTIPEELYEASLIDGAGGYNRFWYITLPMLMPAFTINIILCTIGALKQFDIVFVMTGGGPGYSTEVITTKIYREAFTNSQMGYAMAIGVVLFFAVLAVTIAQYKFFSKREIEE